MLTFWTQADAFPVARLLRLRTMNVRPTTTATTAMTAKRSGYEFPTAANNGTLISEMENCPRFRQVLYPPMIFPDVVAVVSAASVFDTAGLIIPRAIPATTIRAMDDAMDSDIFRKTNDAARRKNPIDMILKGGILWTSLRYIRLMQALVTP